MTLSEAALKYEDDLKGQLYVLSRNCDVRDDGYAEVLLKAVKWEGRVEANERMMRSWLFMVAKSVAFDLMRKWGKEKEIISHEPSYEPWGDIDAELMFETLVAKFPDRDRRVLWCAWLGLSNDAGADLCGMTVPAFKNVMGRARQHVRERFS